ncbi:hypothetical protein MICA_481 [Micavibrio aeruginosavorus ARL-13]|uniref:Uncharacterized protein n=1 Tax=Micavibrio aeruginosavorus (strain ARL-13) TaxID=856793 RepID=G2KLI8_MICAA|nr:hypothetical protein MICA_481 [Micavibrio aeruginosavorus ARL-13]
MPTINKALFYCVLSYRAIVAVIELPDEVGHNGMIIKPFHIFARS